MDTNITDDRAAQLLAMTKHIVNPQGQSKLFSISSGRLDFILSGNKEEEFNLTYQAGRYNLEKRNHHHAYQKTIGLSRLDVNGPTHVNPDGEEIGSTHLHIYRQDYGIKYAIEVPEEYFKDLDDTVGTLLDFMRFCNITNPPPRDFIMP